MLDISMMNLYLYGTFSKEVANITLKDGCLPCIGDQVSEQLEPALWFKVLVLDAISIDCNKKVILWHTSSDLEAVKQTAQYCCDDKVDDDGGVRTNTEDENDSVAGDVPEDKERDSGYRPNRTCGLRHQSSQRIIRRQMSETVYAGGECMGYSSDMDEVFEFTQDILSKLVNNQISQVQFNKEVFLLLHVHVLPNIHLSADDIINVQNAMAIVDCYITDINTLIMDKQLHIDHVQRDMKTQRQKFIHEVCEPNFNNAKFSAAFANILLQQLTEDIAKAQEQLEELTQRVEAAKDNIVSPDDSRASPENDSDRGGNDELLQLRSERSQFMKEFNDLLTARAVLDEYISGERVSMNDEKHSIKGCKPMKSSKKPKNKSEKEKRKSKKRNSSISLDPHNEANPLHAIYLGMEQTYDQMLADTLSLTNRKLLLLSVKETMRGVFETLLSGKETLGIDIDTTGMRRPTDVLRHSQIPIEWLSLPEQVSSVLKDETLPIRESHEKFCELVKQKCTAALQKGKLSIISDSILRESNPPEASLTKTGGLFAENKLYNLMHTDSSSLSSGISSTSDTCNSQTSKSSGSDTYNSRSVNPSCIQPMSSNSSCEALSLGHDHLANSGHLSNSVGSNSNVSEVEDFSEEADEIEQTLTWIKDNVNKLFEEICLKIQEHLGSRGQTQFRRIWQCYEIHFYVEVICSLTELYINAYSPKIRHVLSNLHVLMAKDLDLNGFILNILQDRDLRCEFKEVDEQRTFTLSHKTDTSVTTGDTVCTELNASLNKKKDMVKSGSPQESPDFNQINAVPETESLNAQANSDTTDAKATSDKVTSVEKHILDGRIIVTPPVQSQNCSSQPNIGNDDNLGTREQAQGQNCHNQLQTNTDPAERPTTIFRGSEVEDLAAKGSCKDPAPSSSNSLSSQSSHSSSSVLLSSEITDNELSTSTSEQSINDIDDRIGKHLTCKVISISNPAPMTVTWNVYRENTIHEGKQAANSVPMSPMTMASIKSLQFKPEYKDQFAEAYKMLHQVLQDTSPLFKLQHLFRCLRDLSDQYEQLQKTFCGQSSKPCTDDLIDILALFLCNFEVTGAEMLYAHIMMLSDLMPRFFAGGQFSFTLVQFFAAFQVLQERTLMKHVKQQLK
ncbi:hypothetical protein LSH36_699g02004 [Paralvinella palmiformis]|uniref:VPS9 domain-containing protein n=1 Tax=Paralvinella palmiformis TaxID=53620 RepID=A0AAD9J358_9ANNE|nr:hypothetical protein LSH36_699g02004 [Paralvinella palmiformis]